MRRLSFAGVSSGGSWCGGLSMQECSTKAQLHPAMNANTLIATHFAKLLMPRDYLPRGEQRQRKSGPHNRPCTLSQNAIISPSRHTEVGTARMSSVRVITHKRLKEFWNDPKAPKGAETALSGWYAATEAAEWKNFTDLKKTFNHADAVGDCVVFDVGGNKIRLIGRVRYASDTFEGKVYVLRVMTHAEYDEQDWAEDCGCHKKPPAKKQGPRPVKKPKRKK